MRSQSSADYSRSTYPSGEEYREIPKNILAHYTNRMQIIPLVGSCKCRIFSTKIVLACVEAFIPDDLNVHDEVINKELLKYKNKDGGFGKPLAAGGCFLNMEVAIMEANNGHTVKTPMNPRAGKAPQRKLLAVLSWAHTHINTSPLQKAEGLKGVAEDPLKAVKQYMEVRATRCSWDFLEKAKDAKEATEVAVTLAKALGLLITQAEHSVEVVEAAQKRASLENCSIISNVMGAIKKALGSYNDNLESSTESSESLVEIESELNSSEVESKSQRDSISTTTEEQFAKFVEQAKKATTSMPMPGTITRSMAKKLRPKVLTINEGAKTDGSILLYSSSSANNESSSSTSSEPRSVAKVISVVMTEVGDEEQSSNPQQSHRGEGSSAT
ncbi:hypothetical protein RHSIM_Rhsim09G0062500 [Rhododendron simsii]|uniref:Uncharacterized protein n=1 Tax=Rhododendron simsii TaxID=118357 RepID=A0A834LFR5_RHOSS|nr:hypothetical protein RHSIM_Rhsim09G0062500 [Rhododendron simsii]